MPDTPRTLQTLGQLSTVGLSFVLALVMGFGGGYWLDQQLGSRPWLSFVGFFLGLAAGVMNVYRVLQATASPAPPRGPDAHGPGPSRY
ncbi:MAG TPA: AtpZ/AtpI family protein [Vicinamibacterales bacterium]|nr:AtpZ/AtpI family protein [Vicinamibacterales bacterium]